MLVRLLTTSFVLIGLLILAWQRGHLKAFFGGDRPALDPPRMTGRPTAIHVLLGVAVLELAVNRVAVPMLRPRLGEPPWWHVGLDYAGLFLFYFAGTLAVLVIAARCASMIEARRGVRDVTAHVALALAAVLAAVPLFVSVSSIGLPLEIVFSAAVVALVASVFGRDRDLGIQIGLPLLAIPLLIHLGYTITVIETELVWPEGTLDGPGDGILGTGVLALCVAALITPYCFAPRPFARAVTRPLPIVLAMAIATIGAILARIAYPELARAATLAIGVRMHPGAGDPRLALYLLAIATLAWTLASCALAPSGARRTVGAGIALIVLGGYGFKWPHHFLLPLLGVALIAEAARRVRDEELAALPVVPEAPPITDAAWSTYVGSIAHGLRRTLHDVHSLTTRGEGGSASSLIVGDVAGLPVRTRIERIAGSVLALDVVVGREIDEVRGATLSVWAIPPRGLGANPAAPPATPAFKSGDAGFDERFKIRGSAAAFGRLLDDGLRARAIATLDGWLAYWERDGVRYRVYPGRGSPLDHPLPLSDLALGKVPPNAERLVAVVELLVEIASRGVDVARPAEPAELESAP